MKKVLCFISCIVVLAVAVSFIKNFANKGDVIPGSAKVETFNKTPWNCDELYNNSSLIPKNKLRHSYGLKITFENSRFSTVRYLQSHPGDVAVASHIGDGEVRVTILTDNVRPESYRHIASR